MTQSTSKPTGVQMNAQSTICPTICPTIRSTIRRAIHTSFGVALLSLWLGGCASGLLPKPPATPTLWVLDDATGAASGSPSDAPSAAPLPQSSALKSKALTLIVAVPRAAAGFGTQNIAYLRRPHQIEYFAVHQWVDSPAHMLAPLMARALQRGGAFRAVALAPTAASGEWRLETELLRLQQDFTVSPSRVRLTLRALLIDSTSRRVLAERELDASAASPSEDPEGGAQAANRAVAQILGDLSTFCAETTRSAAP